MRTKGFGPWHVLSIIETSKGSETRVMRRALTKRGAQGWVKFYRLMLDRYGFSEPMVPGFRHYYTVERF